MKRGQRRENEARESCQPSNISLSAQPWPTLIIQNTHATERQSIIVIYLHAISDKFETNSASCKPMPPQITFAVGSSPQNFERAGSIHQINFCEGMRCFRWANFMARNSIMYFTWQKLLMLSDWWLVGKCLTIQGQLGCAARYKPGFESGWLPAFSLLLRLKVSLNIIFQCEASRSYLPSHVIQPDECLHCGTPTASVHPVHIVSCRR